MSSAGERASRRLTNFGRNVSFRPKFLYEPSSEAEIREVLERHRGETIRVVGSLHSWSPLVETPDVVIDLRRMNRVEIRHGAEGIEALVEGGCTVERLLRILDEDAGATLPAIGAVTRQTVAGAIATGTHGSGQHSLSHLAREIRVVAYEGERAVARDLRGDALLAGRCGLGCLGVVVRVRFPCVRQYFVAETVRSFSSLEEVLAQRDAHPLQYFLQLPFARRFVSFRRHELPSRPGAAQRLYTWWRRTRTLLLVDVGFHLLYSRAVSWLRRPGAVRALYRVTAPLLLERRRQVADRSDRALTLHHHLFRHLEMELAVPEAYLVAASELIRFVTDEFAGVETEPPEAALQALEAVGLREELARSRGSYVHSYPLSYRRVLRDDTWLSQSSAGDCYTISWFCYERDTAAFVQYASYLARSMAALYDARPHWGKLFPLARLPQFRGRIRGFPRT